MLGEEQNEPLYNIFLILHGRLYLCLFTSPFFTSHSALFGIRHYYQPIYLPAIRLCTDVINGMIVPCEVFCKMNTQGFHFTYNFYFLVV